MSSTSVWDVTRVELCGAAVGRNSSTLGQKEGPLDEFTLAQDDDAQRMASSSGTRNASYLEQHDGAADGVDGGEFSAELWPGVETLPSRMPCQSSVYCL